MNTSPILKTKDLTFSYEEDKVALKNINVTIAAGERIAVLGANGAGKSTFFLNLNGVRTPDSGSIFLNGTEITKKKRVQLRQSVGIVFQDVDNQIIASTVKAEVAFGPMNMKLPVQEVEQRTTAAIRQMKLNGYEDRPPHYLSGGEKKRVGIADIIAMDSPVIIFDEPTAFLDPVSAQMLEEILYELEQQKKTVLVSTHDVDFAWRFADRVLVFCAGEIIGDGTCEEIFTNTEILKRANLKKPEIMQFCDLLVKTGRLTGMQRYPKDLKELEKLLSGPISNK